eukprot:6179109-Pleurochrysis_carterae.AAC.4
MQRVHISLGLQTAVHAGCASEARSGNCAFSNARSPQHAWKTNAHDARACDLLCMTKHAHPPSHQRELGQATNSDSVERSAAGKEDRHQRHSHYSLPAVPAHARCAPIQHVAYTYLTGTAVFLEELVKGSAAIELLPWQSTVGM